MHTKVKFDEKIEVMQIKKMKLTDLKESPVRYSALPDSLLKRIKAYKKVLGAVENSSLEETITNFKRDLYPENEVMVWEKIARHYKFLIKKNNIVNLDDQKEIFRTILKVSLGAK
jgi:hypothetical protein